MLKQSTFLLLFTVLLSFQCRKPKIERELSKLPPATQTGANTFGCLVNGKAWTPKGSDWNKPNFYIIADPTFEQGSFSLRTYRLEKSRREGFTINSDSIKVVGYYIISDTSNTRPQITTGTADLSTVFCMTDYNGHFNRSGYLKITKYDMQQGIVSGEFEFTMVSRDCGLGDPIRVTNGRFDYHL